MMLFVVRNTLGLSSFSSPKPNCLSNYWSAPVSSCTQQESQPTVKLDETHNPHACFIGLTALQHPFDAYESKLSPLFKTSKNYRQRLNSFSAQKPMLFWITHLKIKTAMEQSRRWDSAPDQHILKANWPPNYANVLSYVAAILGLTCGIHATCSVWLQSWH